MHPDRRISVALVDRLPFNSFTLGSIAVFGKDDASSPLNAYAGHVSFEALWGRSSYSPIFYLPLEMLVGVGGLVTVLLVFKKEEENFITAE